MWLVTRESADVKARRYLVEGRVIVTRVIPGAVDAKVRGGGAVWSVKYRRGGWSCDCPARGRCAHLAAVGLVTAPIAAQPAVRVAA